MLIVTQPTATPASAGLRKNKNSSYSPLNNGFGFYLGDPLQTVHQLPPIHFAIIAYHCNGRDSAALDDEIAMRQRLDSIRPCGKSRCVMSSSSRSSNSRTARKYPEHCAGSQQPLPIRQERRYSARQPG